MTSFHTHDESCIGQPSDLRASGCALTADAVPRPFALIVDDDPRTLAVAGSVLTSLGFTTLLSERPEDAQATAAALLPDLILTDGLMARLDGRALCLQLKNDPRTAAIRVIVTSSLYKGPVHRDEAASKFLVDDYLDKPVRPAVLEDAVCRLMPALKAKAAQEIRDPSGRRTAGIQ